MRTFYEAESGVRTEIHSERGCSLGPDRNAKPGLAPNGQSGPNGVRTGIRELTHFGERPLGYGRSRPVIDRTFGTLMSASGSFWEPDGGKLWKRRLDFRELEKIDQGLLLAISVGNSVSLVRGLLVVWWCRGL